jgi:hypothetical protein
MLHCIDESKVSHEAAIADPEVYRAIDAWDAEMEERGVLVGGARLRTISHATTVRTRNGEVLISDGPFAETKEQIAGYTVIECADLDEAIEVASRHPTAKLGTFELRPFWE